MTLFARTSGSPDQPTVVLLHGASVSSWMWTGTMAALPGYHMLAPDLPGLGQNAQTGAFSIQQAADLLADFIRQQTSGGQAHVVGHSLGGAVAAKLLARHPEVVRSAVLIGVTAQPLPFERAFTALTLALSAASRSRTVLGWQAKALGVPEGHRAQFIEEGLAQTRADLEILLREGMAFRIPSELESVHVPVLALVGEREGAVNVRSAQALAGAVPGGVAAAVPRGGHAWLGTQPELLHQTLQAWLSQAPLPPSLRPLGPTGQASLA